MIRGFYVHYRFAPQQAIKKSSTHTRECLTRILCFSRQETQTAGRVSPPSRFHSFAQMPIFFAEKVRAFIAYSVSSAYNASST